MHCLGLTRLARLNNHGFYFRRLNVLRVIDVIRPKKTVGIIYPRYSLAGSGVQYIFDKKKKVKKGVFFVL